MNFEEKQTYQFNLHHELAAESDSFSDKTHEKVAKTIAEFIESSKSSITIGLEGEWGSGKSTVIKLLQNILDSSAPHKTLVFIFDAWSHSGDPLRRSFLESLIRSLDPDHNIAPLNKIKEKITGKEKIVKSTSNRGFQPFGRYISFATMFVPLGLGLLSSLDFNNIIWPLDIRAGSFNWQFGFGLLFIALPVWVTVLWFFMKKKEGPGKFDVFDSRSESTHTTTVTEESERTSVEYENFFCQILELSLGASQRYERVVIVLDNIDRIPPTQAKIVWPTLQHFAQCVQNINQRQSCEWASNTWFLVPYDREALHCIWDDKPQDAVPDHMPNFKVTSSIISKCFQLVAEVPTPVFSGWLEYCEKYIDSGLVGWSNDERHEILETYRRYICDLRESPSPREILSFINQVGLQGMRWGGEISPEAIALYELFKQNRSSPQVRQMLLSDDWLDDYEAQNSREQLKGEVAGLLFGVSHEKGMQLLLKPEIQAAITKADGNALSALIEAHGEGFWVVWQAIKSQIIPNGHSDEYKISFTTAFCIGTSKYAAKNSRDMEKLSGEWMNSEERWNLNRYDYSMAFRALMNIQDQHAADAFKDWLDDKTRHELQLLIDELESESFRSNSLLNLKNLFDLLDSVNKLKIESYPSLDSSRWPLWCEALNNEEIEIPHVAPAKSAIAESALSLKPNVAEDSTLLSLNMAFSIVPTDPGWVTVLDSIVDFGNRGDFSVASSMTTDLLLNLYLILDQEGKDKIASCVGNANFMGTASTADLSVMPSLAVLYACIFKDKLQTSQVPENVKALWKSNLEIDNVETLLAVLRKTETVPIIWALATETQNLLAKNLVLNLPDSMLIASDNGVYFIDDYSWAEEAQLRALVDRLEAGGAIERAKKWLVESPEYYPDNLAILNKYGNQATQEIVGSAINNLTTDQWEECLNEGGGGLLSCLNDKGNYKFKDAFLRILKQQIAEDQSDGEVWKIVSDCRDRLIDAADVFKELTRYYFYLDEDNLTDEAFNSVKQEFSKFVEAIAGRELATRVDFWLKTEDWDRIRWLLDCKFVFKGDFPDSLKPRVQDLMSNADDEEITEILKTINKKFKLKI